MPRGHPRQSAATSVLRWAILFLAASGTRVKDIPFRLEDMGLPKRKKAMIYQIIASAKDPAATSKIDAAVGECIRIGGHAYGYRLLKADVEDFLGKKVSKRKLLASMRRVNPWAVDQRTNFALNRTRVGAYDGVVVEGEWWQTDLDWYVHTHSLTSVQHPWPPSISSFPTRYSLIPSLHLDLPPTPLALTRVACSSCALGSKLSPFGLYCGAVVDVATRYVYAAEVFSHRSAYECFHVLYEPVIRRQGGLPAKFTMDKGGEVHLLGFAILYSKAKHDRGGGDVTVPAQQRYVRSKTHSRIERWWGYLNPTTVTPLKRVLMAMENDGDLDVGDTFQLGAVQAVAGLLFRFGVDLALRRWNAHTMLSRGGKTILGTPNDMRNAAPKLTARVPLHPNVVAAYEAAHGGVPVNREAPWAASHDALYHDAARQAARHEAVHEALGDVEDAWVDVLHNGGLRLREAIKVFIDFR